MALFVQQPGADIIAGNETIEVVAIEKEKFIVTAAQEKLPVFVPFLCFKLRNPFQKPRGQKGGKKPLAVYAKTAAQRAIGELVGEFMDHDAVYPAQRASGFLQHGVGEKFNGVA